MATETLSARAQVANAVRHGHDPAAIQAARDRLLVAKIRALLATKEAAS